MRAVIQRVKEASVSIDAMVHANIGRGLLVLLAVESEDDQQDIDWMARKILNMRIFADDQSLMNKSVLEIQDSAIMVISQFTLFASTRKGNRPSFIKAAAPSFATRMYERFIVHIAAQSHVPIKTGIFAADMQVQLCNDGPVTIILDSKRKE